ncbi:hypothetical protein MIR68_001584 [Amoeboaphelidium protococcarum]|nr:hypothetical protein MIR68_001584 [Amoeboaphelidium protococcarum]
MAQCCLLYIHPVLISSDLDRMDITWEKADFPIACERCLGENPHMRMNKVEYGAQCKMCNTPFTVFKWSPGRNMRYKVTAICQKCARARNACQTCLNDLDLGIDSHTRDVAMGSRSVSNRR